MGHYIDNNLIKGEEVIYETTHHWIIFFSLRSLLTLFIWPIIKRNTDEFVITNKRVVVKIGLISRKTFEMNLNKIETVNVDQSIIARILGMARYASSGPAAPVKHFPVSVMRSSFVKNLLRPARCRSGLILRVSITSILPL